MAWRRLLGVIAALAGTALAGCGGGAATTPDGLAGAAGTTGGAGATGGAGTTDATGGAGTTGGAGATGPKCPEFVPCGGDVVGTWAPDPTCAPTTKAVGGGSCAGETWDVTTVVSSPSSIFGAGGTMTIRLVAAGFATVTAPDACLPSASGAPVACADAGPLYAARIVFVGGKASSGGCARSGADCRCTIDFTPAPVDSPGSYSIAGTTLSAVVGDRPAMLDYCVAGSKLRMRNHDQNGPPGEPGSYVKQ